MNDGALTPSQAINLAHSAYRAGRLAETEQICRQVLGTKSDDFDALHLLAVVQSRLGDNDAALATYDRALAVRPDHAEARANRGNTLHALGRFEEAVASYDLALALQPDRAETLSNRGATLRQLKRFDEALASYDRALTVRPGVAATLSNRGNILHELQRFEEALASYDRALAVRPDYAEAYFNRAKTLRDLQRFDEAVASYDGALALQPDFAEAAFNRGNTLYELRRFEEALASYDRALGVRPDHPGALLNRGNALRELGRFGEALANSDSVLAAHPDDAAALTSRGIALHELRRFEESLQSYDHALTLQPDDPATLTNRGNVLTELKRFDEALASYGHAVSVRPDFAAAHVAEALCRLLIGDFDHGLEKYEWRWQREQNKKDKRNFAQPPWLGAGEITGKTILLHAEQGFGDTIQYCRYVPLAAARGASVILEVQEPLQDLMGTLGGAAQIVRRGDALPAFDVHCPLPSLPLAFGTRLETIPAATPYLHALPQSVMKWKARLGPARRPRIGLAWSGSSTNRKDRDRSIGLSVLLPLLDADATFVSLQQEVRADDAPALQSRSDVLHFGAALKDFTDTAALIANLDLVIAVDTAVAHLAGALAKPTWLLLPAVPDPRWLLDRDDSPWYPTARLFRQDESRAWQDVIARVHTVLREFLRFRS